MKDEAHSNSVMKTMVLFSLAMIFFPVFLYFFTKAVIFEGRLMRSKRSKQVIEVHCILQMPVPCTCVIQFVESPFKNQIHCSTLYHD